MIKKEKHMRSQPSNVIPWKTLVVLAAILACTLVMPLNAQTQPTRKRPHKLHRRRLTIRNKLRKL